MTANRKWVLVSVVAIISLPVLMAMTKARTFHVANRSNREMVIAREKRDYLLYVPNSYDPRKPTPLVISMHGAGLWGAAQKELSLWNSAADARGFIVVYPSGARGSGPRIWHVEPSPRLMNDVRFISAIIDTMEAQYNIDRTRIYANGISNGGGMSFVLSCTLSDRIAAVGLVAAAQTLPWKWCKDTKPVPMISFHGTADPVVPYDGGTSWISPRAFPSTPRWAANWARRNRCAEKPVESQLAADVTRREYTQCADSATVVLYTIRGGGHTWPGGKELPQSWTGSTSRTIDATSVMWAFYLAHPMSHSTCPMASSCGSSTLRSPTTTIVIRSGLK